MTTVLTSIFLAVTIVVALSFDAVQAAAVPWAVHRTGNSPDEGQQLISSKVRRSWESFFYDPLFDDEQISDEFLEEGDDDDKRMKLARLVKKVADIAKTRRDEDEGEINDEMLAKRVELPRREDKEEEDRLLKKSTMKKTAMSRRNDDDDEDRLAKKTAGTKVAASRRDEDDEEDRLLKKSTLKRTAMSRRDEDDDDNDSDDDDEDESDDDEDRLAKKTAGTKVAASRRDENDEEDLLSLAKKWLQNAVTKRASLPVGGTKVSRTARRFGFGDKTHGSRSASKHDAKSVESGVEDHRRSSGPMSGQRRQFNSALGIGIDAPATTFGAGTSDPYGGGWGGGQSARTPWDSYRDEDTDDMEELHDYSYDDYDEDSPLPLTNNKRNIAWMFDTSPSERSDDDEYKNVAAKRAKVTEIVRRLLLKRDSSRKSTSGN